jgi:hypothetical protein
MFESKHLERNPTSRFSMTSSDSWAFAYDEIVYTGMGAQVMFARGINYLVEMRQHMFVLNNRTQ